ncbi:unnamed protein product [Victoria cruziana]
MGFRERAARFVVTSVAEGTPHLLSPPRALPFHGGSRGRILGYTPPRLSSRPPPSVLPPPYATGVSLLSLDGERHMMMMMLEA